MNELGRHRSRHALELQGIRNPTQTYWNLLPTWLCEEAIRRGEACLSEDGALLTETGQFTGRSPRDRYIVDVPSVHDHIDWGRSNQPLPLHNWASLKSQVLAFLQGRDLFVQDLFAGADPEYRLPIRVVTTLAWHSLFAHNMFVRPEPHELEVHEPAFTVLCAPGFVADAAREGLNSGAFIALNLEEQMILIGGTGYAGEIKKSVFSVMNYLLPLREVLPMHCSANVGSNGEVALFFGLSGTGKTTLSADQSRTLVGDDEHGWSSHGVFNFEGGCYAKVIRLSPQGEPEIYATTRRFGTILENVDHDAETRRLDLDSARLTENTRASYPIGMIPNASETGRAGHPRHIIMLTCDAFGVLPPVARLTPEQAMYHFLCGYTAKVAGTERGLSKEPKATFSTCFGAPFMPRRPSAYAELLGHKIARHSAKSWLVNTGWTGGPYGVGSRIKLAYTRAMVNAILSGKLDETETATDPIFGLHAPLSIAGVPGDLLRPRETWDDPSAYERKAQELAGRFHEKFKNYEAHVSEAVRRAAPPGGKRG